MTSLGDDTAVAREVVGVDVGGSGVKAALVDVQKGTFEGRERVPTPSPATPDAIAATVAELVQQFPGSGPFGCTVPAVVMNGVVRTAAHIDEAWIGTDAGDVLTQAAGRRCVVLNDADAAGIAEARYGAARGHHGLVVMVTIGTGVGTAVLNVGVLVPNSELGHIWIGDDVKTVGDAWVSDAARNADDLSWKHWSARLNRYLTELHALLWPDLFVLGGGVVKHSDKFVERLDPGCDVRIAELGNPAGIVGAAAVAADAADAEDKD
jgi:polyphosphate glucokinase